MTKFLSTLVSIITLIGLILPGIKYGFKPTLEVNCANEVSEVSNYATGFLYGLATEGVPSKEMVESIDVSSVSQKTVGGLQHPIGDVDDVSANLESCDYIVVYLQDCFDTWYYCYDEIMDLRREGKYDWNEFIKERFFPQVKEQVEKLSASDYSDRVVYCLYNECDNATWFGAEDENGWPQFNDEGRQNFYSAWKQTYDFVRSIDPNAKIGGPGYYEYSAEKLTSFLGYCTENNCVPNIMIYHELSGISAAFFEDHFEEYRNIEKSIGIDPLAIIVTEYGCMDECGNPGTMLDYVCAMEKTGVYGNVAFWRLANNLCDTAADDNSPNANWWLYRWYADMEGYLLKTNIIDIMHSDVENVVKYNRDRFHYVPLNGLSSINESKDEITVILGGCDYTSYVVLRNLIKTKLGNSPVNVKIEGVYYKGLSGVLSSPVTLSEYTAYAANSLCIKVGCTDTSSVYRVTVSKADKLSKDKFTGVNIPVRYEFEEGTLLGTAYTYDSAYATTGLQAGMVGGIENVGDGISIKINAPKSGLYQLDVIYGKSNDGRTPADRASAKALFSIDGNESTITLANTVRSEFTSCITLTAELTAGTHEITFKHGEGTYTLDSMLVSPSEEQSEISVLPDSDRSNSETAAYLAVAPYDGFYTMKVTPNASFLLDGAKCKASESGRAVIYLRRGLNYIEVKDTACTSCTVSTSSIEAATCKVNASDMALSDGALLKSEAGVTYVDGISSNGGKAEFKVYVPESGSYRMTLTYSNNREGGVHSYNVDLIECYVTVSVNGKDSSNVWCRNTMSLENFKTVTANVELNAGENVITFTNNGASLFNNITAYAPNISGVTIAQACSGLK